MNYAYIRVSTAGQDVENQRYEILKYANDHQLHNIGFTAEIISSRTPISKRSISNIIEKAQSGDILIVTELSRLGRSMLEVFEILSLLLKKNVAIHITKSNMILKDDITSKVFSFAFSLASEIERDLISQRTKEALQAKKASGMKLGRPKNSKSSKLDSKINEIKALCDKGVSITSIAKILEVPQPTMYYFCKTRGLLG